MSRPSKARFLLNPHGADGEVSKFAIDILVREPRRITRSDTGILSYLEALTYTFDHGGEDVSCVLTYAVPAIDQPGWYQCVIAADTGYEGIACVDDTARAALLALRVYERNHSRKALALAKDWLTFVEYMQYPDGSFANFIRNSAGMRNASGPTSVKGGYWWSVRAQWALACAFRITADVSYRQSYERCHLPPTPDGKINAIQALAELELYQAEPSDGLKSSILAHCEAILADQSNGYFLDHPGTQRVSLWGYHQLHAVAEAARALQHPALLRACRHTVTFLVEPDVKAMFWYSYPDREKNGVCAYAVAPIVQGLASLYRATDANRYRLLALRGAAWFYGRNDARTRMYDPATGMCRDGITDAVASDNYGAESSIEAGFSELERRDLGPAV
jgi:hypothetical protein